MSKVLFVCAMCVAMVGGIAAQTAQAPAVVLNVGDQAPDFTPDGRIAFIDKEVGKRVATAGPDVVAKLTELKARKKS
jgi:hypothetical protein